MGSIIALHPMEFVAEPRYDRTPLVIPVVGESFDAPPSLGHSG
jgi:hypothetical protein